MCGDIFKPNITCHTQVIGLLEHSLCKHINWLHNIDWLVKYSLTLLVVNENDDRVNENPGFLSSLKTQTNSSCDHYSWNPSNYFRNEIDDRVNEDPGYIFFTQNTKNSICGIVRKHINKFDLADKNKIETHIPSEIPGKITNVGNV